MKNIHPKPSLTASALNATKRIFLFGVSFLTVVQMSSQFLVIGGANYLHFQKYGDWWTAGWRGGFVRFWYSYQWNISSGGSCDFEILKFSFCCILPWIKHCTYQVLQEFSEWSERCPGKLFAKGVSTIRIPGLVSINLSTATGQEFVLHCPFSQVSLRL